MAETEEVTTTPLILAVPSPSDLSHEASHSRPAGPRRRQAPSVSKFSEPPPDSHRQTLSVVDPDMVDQVRFRNPLLENDEGDEGGKPDRMRSGTSNLGVSNDSVEAALAKQALEQMKHLKVSHVEKHEVQRVVPEAAKVQLRKTEPVEKKKVDGDRPLSEAQAALSRLKKVETSPMKAELAKMSANSPALGSSSTDAEPSTPKGEIQEAQVESPGEVSIRIEPEANAQKAVGCCVIL